MKNFLVLYMAPKSVIESFKNMTPEDGEKEMQEWGAWMEKNMSHMKDPGNPIGKNTRIQGTAKGQDISNEVCGYSILQASDKDEALSILADSPHLINPDMYIELMEITDMEM